MRLPAMLRKRFASPPAAEGEPSAPRSDGDDSLPIPDYEQLSTKEITDRLHLLTQVELGVIEDHERSHRERAAVLTKLGWMREDEPLPGYDQLEAGKVVLMLADADAETIRTIRDYERKFQHRREISEAVARLLPKAKPSAREDRVVEERAARITAGHRSRTAAGERLTDARSVSDAGPVQQ
jgi:hypothetical protein